jgi:hypothetical protein
MLRCSILCLASILVALTACDRSHAPQPIAVEPAYISSSGSVPFDISPVKSGDDLARGEWIATYTSQGRTARFRIIIDSSNAKDQKFASGQGKFVAEPGSDAAALIPELGKELEANSLPKKVQRTSALPFEYANLGDHLSRIPGGGFHANPPGHWTALKVFLGEGDDEAEVFLNFNPALGKAEFSIKDADYGNAILAKLAQVL